MRHLLPCPSCACLIRAHETRCPFCERATGDSFASTPAPRRLPTGASRKAYEPYMSRPAALAGGMVLVGAALMGTQCGSRTQLLPGGGGDGGLEECAPPPGGSAGVGVAVYGISPMIECEGDSAKAVPPSECPQCDGGRAFKLCIGGQYATCSCAVPPGYTACQ